MDPISFAAPLFSFFRKLIKKLVKYSFEVTI
ncbi:unknown [Clostridium sp. CAG:43]|nr:unknown [Clostridium sp. CAG:43]